MLGSGVLDKLILRFTHCFWDPSLDWLNYIAPYDTPYTWTQTLNYYKFTGKPILIMFNCEQSAHHFSTYTDEELLQSAFDVLEKTYPEINAREHLVEHIRTNWTLDPNAQMCYTYLGKEASPKDCETLGKPIDGKVYFAGEHTSFEFIGTVNAAYISGMKAGERVIGEYVQSLFTMACCIALISTIY